LVWVVVSGSAIYCFALVFTVTAKGALDAALWRSIY
jgi:hypothetical protein